MNTINFRTLTYLKQGNKVQQHIAEILEESRVMDVLNAFDPVLVGTFPIDIAIESSDLDVACCFENKEQFIADVNSAFSGLDGYTLTEVVMDNLPTVVVNFILKGYPVELFAQPISVDKQNGYRHMLIEYEILKAKGEHFRQEIIKLKKAGMKTEPAFAQLLGLKDDPYKAMLAYKV